MGRNIAIAVGGPYDGKILDGQGHIMRVPVPPEPGEPPGFGDFEYTLALIGSQLFWRSSAISDYEALSIVFGRYAKHEEDRESIVNLKKIIDSMAENDDHFAWELAAALDMDLDGATPGSIRYDAIIKINAGKNSGRRLAAVERRLASLETEIAGLKPKRMKR